VTLANAKYALSEAILKVCSDNSIPVERENAPLIVKPSKWARMFHRGNVPQPFTLGAGGDDKANGFYQVDVLYPAGSGDADADTDLELFRAALNRKTFTHNGQYVKVMSCGAPHRTIEDDTWFVMTININWEALVTV
jgi:hypothetical protein